MSGAKADDKKAFSGTIEKTRWYLLDAERLIRLRGLPKSNLSRKVRLLHHCYAYLRIFNESTLVLPTDSPNAEHDETSIARSLASCFRLSKWPENIGEKMNEDKERDTGEKDLHLEVPGKWDSSMYPGIYGVPESFLVLLSQSIRLANERDILYQSPRDASLRIEHFFQYSKGVERQICDWQAQSYLYPDGFDPSVSADLLESNKRAVALLLQAMQHALKIFFYRRVYGLCSDILQPYVVQTIEALEGIEEEDKASGGRTVTMVWPAFIAACEAQNGDLQMRYEKWFEASIVGCGLPAFERAKDLAQRIWKARRTPGNSDIGWPALVREHGLVVVCA